MDTSSRTCFCDWFLPGGPSPLCLHPCFYSVQEVPSQGDANPCRVGLSQHQNLHLGCSPSHDECRRHHPYLAVGPRCLFPGGSKKVYDFWFTPSGHTAFCLYNFQPMGTLGGTILPPAQDGSSPKSNSSDTCLHQNFFQGVRARAQATPLPPWNSLFRRSHLRWVGKNKKTTISAFICNHSGNGMPEEFFFLLLELGLGIGFGLTPASLNRLVQCQWYFEESDQFYTVWLLSP